MTGRRKGRPKNVIARTKAYYLAHLNPDMPLHEVADKINVSHTTVWRWYKEWGLTKKQMYVKGGKNE